MTIEPTVSDAEVEAALDAKPFDRMPVHAFLIDAELSRDEAKTIMRAALLAAARVRSAIPETEAVATITELGEVMVASPTAFKAMFDAMPEVPHGGIKSIEVYTHPVLPDREGYKAGDTDWDEVDQVEAMVRSMIDREKLPTQWSSQGGVDHWRDVMRKARRAMIAASPATGEREPSRATDTAVDQGRAKP